MKAIFISILLLGLTEFAFGDYENTWNFYYEQPCCGNTNGQHHLRHHKGNGKLTNFHKKEIIFILTPHTLQTMLENLRAANFIIGHFIWTRNRMRYMLEQCKLFDSQRT